MKAIVISGKNAISIKEVDTPTIHDGEVLVKIHSVGICKTDLEILHGDHPFTMKKFSSNPNFSLIPGHEWSGVVVRTGRKCGDLKPGDHVVGETTVPCRSCGYCKQGDINLCNDLEEIGVTRDGAFAEFIAVPCSTTHKIPNTIPFDEAAMIEPTAVALHAVDKALEVMNCESLSKKRVAIFGDGPIGLLCLQAVKLQNPKFSAVIGKSDMKLKIAKWTGCDAIVNTNGMEMPEIANHILSKIDGIGFDLVIDATSADTGSNNAINESLAVLNKLGTLIVVGIHNKIELDMNDIVFKEITVRGVISSPNTWDRAIKYVASDKFHISEMITREITLGNTPEEYHFITEHPDKVIKSICVFD